MAAQVLNKPYPDLWDALDGLKSVRVYPKGTALFQQGRPARGIYLIEKGEVRLLLGSGPEQRQVFEVAGPGVLLGLSESVSGEDHKLTAEAMNRTQVAYIGRRELLNFLRQDHGVCLQIVRLLSEDLHGLYHRFRCLDGVSARPGRKSSSKLN